MTELDSCSCSLKLGKQQPSQVPWVWHAGPPDLQYAVDGLAGPRLHPVVANLFITCTLNLCTRQTVSVTWDYSLDTLAERLRRRPAKPMGSLCVGSNPTGVACMHCCDAFLLPRNLGARAVRRNEKPFFDHAAACHYCRCTATAYFSLQLSSSM